VTDRGWIKWLIAGFILYISFMLVNLPASWAVWLAHKTELPITLSGVDGTAWNGSANIAAQIPAMAGFEPSRIRWRINPFYMITGRIGIQLELASKDIVMSAKGKAAIGKVTFHHIEAKLPAATAALLSPIAANAGLTGIIRVNSNSLSLSKTSITGGAEIRIDSLASAWFGAGNTGSYDIDLLAEDKVVRYAVKTRSGPFQLTGTGEWEPITTGRLAFNGKLSGNQGTPLPPVLQGLGKSGSDGSIRLIWSHQFPYFLTSAERS